MVNIKPPTANQITAELLIRLPRELPNVWAWRNNTGAVKIDKRFIRFGLPGAPDVLLVGPGGRLLGLEIKGPGDKQSIAQESWCARLRAAGGVYILVDKIGWDSDRKPDVSRVIAELRRCL